MFLNFLVYNYPNNNLVIYIPNYILFTFLFTYVSSVYFQINCHLLTLDTHVSHAMLGAIGTFFFCSALWEKNGNNFH
jgi:hypothetical protein